MLKMTKRNLPIVLRSKVNYFAENRHKALANQIGLTDKGRVSKLLFNFTFHNSDVSAKTTNEIDH